MLATRMRMAAAGVTGTPAAGWWVVAGKTCVAAYQPIGAASLAASYSNLANPGTYDAAPGVAPTWASGTGWTFNGSTQYLDATGLILNRPCTFLLRGSQAASDAGGMLWTGGTSQGTGVSIGLGTTFSTNDDYVVSLSSAIAWLKSGTQATLSGFVLGGAFAAGATGVAAAYNLYLDGVGIKNGTVGIYDTSSATRIGLGQDGRNCAFVAKAIAIYSDTLSGAEVATLSAAMAALT